MQELKERLMDECARVHGENGVTFSLELLVDKYIYLETLVRQARNELDESGIREKYSVSKYQTGRRENKAIGVLVKLEAQQTKILRELKLLPGGRGKTEDELDKYDEGSIDDY